MLGCGLIVVLGTMLSTGMVQARPAKAAKG